MGKSMALLRGGDAVFGDKEGGDGNEFSVIFP